MRILYKGGELFSLLRSSEGLKQSVLTTVGNFLATSLSALAIIIITRLLGPTGFGDFSVGFAIVLILSRVIDFGLNAAIVRYGSASKDKLEINDIFSFTFQVKIILSVIVGLVGVIGVYILTPYMNFAEPFILYGAFIFASATVLYEHLLFSLQALHRFTQSVLINAIQAGTKLISACLLFVTNTTIPAIAFTLYVLAPIVPFLLWRRFMPKWVSIDVLKSYRARRNQIISMAKHTAVGFIAAGFIENVDVLFVRRYLDAYDTGLLAGVSRISMMILLLAYSMSNVLYPRVARYKTKEDLRSYILKCFGLLLLAGIGYLLCVAVAPLLIQYSIGPEYLPATNILLILIGGAFLTIGTIPFIGLFYTLEAPWYFSISGLGQLILIVAGNMIFVPEFGIVGSAWTRFGTRVFLFAFTLLAGLWVYFSEYEKKPTR